jgi:hypothetical protein
LYACRAHLREGWSGHTIDRVTGKVEKFAQGLFGKSPGLWAKNRCIVQPPRSSEIRPQFFGTSSVGFWWGIPGTGRTGPMLGGMCGIGGIVGSPAT